MRIGLISDTHGSKVASGIPPQVRDVFEGVHLILHAGDIYDVCVLDELESIAPVLAASGDDDVGEVLADERVKDKHSLTIEGVRLSLTHEVDSPESVRKRTWDLRYLSGEQYAKEWCGSVADILIIGHLHQAAIEYHDGLLLVSPGSPSLPNYESRPGTVGLLTITSGEVEVRIVQL